MTDLSIVLRRLLARRSLVVADDDVAVAYEFVRLALDQAAADHAAYAARSTKAPETRHLARIGELAAKASAGDAAALARLRDEIGDGADVDAAVALSVGGPVAGFTDVASHFARAEPRHVRWWAQRVADACEAATAPAPRRRRGRKFFSVLALAFVFVDLTGEAPSFTTVEEVDVRGRGEWRRCGAFADLVEAADTAFDFAQGEGLDAAIADALRVGRAEIFLHCSTPGRPWPVSFGAPLFALDTSGGGVDDVV